MQGHRPLETRHALLSSEFDAPPPSHTPTYVCFVFSLAEPFQEFDGGPCCMQFGCMVHRGYYPSEDERLKGAMILSPAQDALPLFLESAESVKAITGKKVKSCGHIEQSVLDNQLLASLCIVRPHSHSCVEELMYAKEVQSERCPLGRFRTVGVPATVPWCGPCGGCMPFRRMSKAFAR